MVSLKVPEGKSIYSTYDENILSSTERTEMSMKRKILALRSRHSMQPQADIDEIELETMIPMLLYLLFQWLALLQQMNPGSPMDLERMYKIS